MAENQDNKDNPFLFEADVDVTHLKDSLSTAEKCYLELAKSINKLTESLDAQKTKHDKAAKSAKDAASVSLKEKTKFTGMITKLFRREKDAADDYGISMKNVLGLIGGATAIGLIGKAMSAYLTFERTILDLNTVMSGNAELMHQSSEVIQEMTGHLDVSREELARMVTQMGELRLIGGVARESSMSVKELTESALYLAKSMDVSTSRVIDFYTEFTKVYKLPHHRLNNIAASMRFIQESTSISGDELITFATGLDDVLTRMTKISGEKVGDVTTDLMAMAGVMKDLGIESRNLPGLFSAALDLDSDQGRDWLAYVTRNTRYTMDQMRDIIEKGDTVTPMKLFIQQMKKDGPEALKMNSKYYTEMTGFSHTELVKLMKVNDEVLDTMIMGARKAYLEGNKHQVDAEKRHNAMLKTWNNFKRVLEDIWLAVGGGIVKALTPMIQTILPAITNWLKDGQGFKNMFKWISDLFKNELIPDLKIAWGALKSLGSVLGVVGSGIKSLIDIWSGMPDIEKWGVAIGTVAVMGLFKFSSALNSLSSSLPGLAANLGKVSSVLGKAGLVGAALGAGYALGKALDKAFGLSDKLSEVALIGQRRASAMKATAYDRRDFMIESVRQAKNLMDVQKNVGFVTERGKRTAVTQSMVKRRIQDYLKRVGADAKTSSAAMSMVSNMVSKLPTQAMTLPQMSTSVSPESISTPTPEQISTPTSSKIVPMKNPDVPKITVTAKSPTSERLLGGILDVLEDMNSKKLVSTPNGAVLNDAF